MPNHPQFPGSDHSRSFFEDGLNPLSDQVAYPRLNQAELEEVAPVGDRFAFAPNDPLVSAGEYPFNSFEVLFGMVRAVDTSFVRYGAGYFTGEIDLLTRRPSLVSVQAETAVEAIRLAPKQLRNLFTRRPQLREKLWKSDQRRMQPERGIGELLS
jgi:thioredoxin reductase (NADPH)